MAQGSRPMAKAPSSIDKKLIREMAELLDESDLSEIEVEISGMRIKVARDRIGPVASAPVTVAAAPPPVVVPVVEAAPTSDANTIKSPMVGTIYLAPEPGAAAFIEAGSDVVAGQTIMIVEAMKTMNSIIAPKAGKVKEILVENSQPVEFGEPLAIIE
jgi:acetyl-CoA carboxylase biotin carboxyl carrier protein